MIKGGGYANIRDARRDPATNELTVDVNKTWYLTDIININVVTTKALPSINPGDPPTHLNELIQNISQIKRNKSPGNVRENVNEPITG